MTKLLRKYWLLSILTVVLIVGLCYLLINNTTVGKAFGSAISNSFITFDSYSVDGTSHESSHVDWIKFKNFILLIVAFSILLIALCSYLISQLLIRKDRQKIAHLIEESRLQQPMVPDSNYLSIQNELKQMQLMNQESNDKLQAETQRTKDLITYLAHDLRTPLSSVIGYLNLLLDTPEISEKTRNKYLNVSLDKANRLDTLIEEFFDITRFNFQHITVNYSEFNLYHLLQQLTEEFYPKLTAKGQSIELKVPDNFQIKADPDKLARVFNNILKNAIAYSSPNQVLTIEANKDDTWTNINFRNNGPEIPESKKETIFDKFYRLDNARDTQSGGAGLGLAIAKEIIEAHHGQIGLTSDPLETVFWIKLPN